VGEGYGKSEAPTYHACRSPATLRGAVTFVLFRPVGGRGSFATTSVAGIGAGAVGAQGGTVAPAPAVDPSATCQLVAGLTGLTGLNVALNVHGLMDGGLTLTVPVGWTVVTHLITTGCFPIPPR